VWSPSVTTPCRIKRRYRAVPSKLTERGKKNFLARHAAVFERIYRASGTKSLYTNYSCPPPRRNCYPTERSRARDFYWQLSNAPPSKQPRASDYYSPGEISFYTNAPRARARNKSRRGLPPGEIRKIVDSFHAIVGTDANVIITSTS